MKKRRDLCNKTPNLYETLQELKDPRRDQGKMHSLPLIIILAIMAIMSGFTNQRAIGDFIEKNKKDLVKQFKPKKNRLPKRKTVARALKKLDFNHFNKIFQEWTEKNCEIKKKDWVSIDGKFIKGTVKDPSTKWQKITNLVSVFQSINKQVLTTGKVESKSNEIPLVQKLIKDLNLENVVFTLDALHCQKETVQVIREKENDYIIGVKENQKKLLETVKKTAQLVNRKDFT